MILSAYMKVIKTVDKTGWDNALFLKKKNNLDVNEINK